MTFLVLLVACIVATLLWGVGVYNSLVTLRNRVDNAWSHIDVQLQRRLDLIPNLVTTVQGYTSHEADILVKVTHARSALMGASTRADKMAADSLLAETLRSLFAVSEAYPDLKASTNFLELQGSLADTEDKISAMRHAYNDAVLIYNTAIQKFPTLIVAKVMRFKTRSDFNAAAGADVAQALGF